MLNVFVRCKPEIINWEEIAECQRKAHVANKKLGVSMMCASMDGIALSQSVGDGICLVALDNDEKLMGTLSVKISEMNRWYHKGKAGYICYVAVLPEFRGQGVYKALSKKAEEIMKEYEISVLYLHTHVNNKTARKAYKNDGYKCVRFTATGGTNYYSVEMVKWIINRGVNKIICSFFYFMSYVIVRIIWKPGRVKRFF